MVLRASVRLSGTAQQLELFLFMKHRCPTCVYKVLEVTFKPTHKDILKHINHKTEMYTENCMCKNIKWPPSLPKIREKGKRMPVSRRHISNPTGTVAPADENGYF